MAHGERDHPRLVLADPFLDDPTRMAKNFVDRPVNAARIGPQASNAKCRLLQDHPACAITNEEPNRASHILGKAAQTPGHRRKSLVCRLRKRQRIEAMCLNQIAHLAQRKLARVLYVLLQRSKRDLPRRVADQVIAARNNGGHTCRATRPFKLGEVMVMAFHECMELFQRCPHRHFRTGRALQIPNQRFGLGGQALTVFINVAVKPTLPLRLQRLTIGQDGRR